MSNRIYTGNVWHHRVSPVEHRFAYRTSYVYLDLDNLPQDTRRGLLWSSHKPALARFKRSDYLGDACIPLSEAVRAHITEAFPQARPGRVGLLTHLRYFGYCFNPVSFYYCYARDSEAVEFVVAEITNIPWGERHAYVLDARGQEANDTLSFDFGKQFHISPFMPMAQAYSWQLGKPGETLAIRMENRTADKKVFNAGMRLEAAPFCAGALAKSLLRFPFMTAKVSSAIYWQAARLYLKGVPTHSHPKHLTQAEKTAQRMRT